ncbi:hypothetical protein [uncultured Tateyamaria sp.]|uniref:hypothetical protein n=1 Tax=uncultured Tateyamaria sp. TaxID=455651 RepID=UPI002633A8D4|nr:hypothetical protein [uncultured Tateyamaria sp.]
MSIKGPAIATAILVAGVWLWSVGLAMIEAYAPHSTWRSTLTGKPVAAIYLEKTWGVALSDGSDKMFAPWAALFDTSGAIRDDTPVVDQAEAFLIFVDGAAPITDPHLETLDVWDDIAALGAQGVSITQSMQWGLYGSWPFLYPKRRNVVIVDAQIALQDIDRACHPEILTAWTAPGSANIATLRARCTTTPAADT